MSELARRLSRGDADAFADLYDTCADQLFAYVAMRLGSPHEAADVVQETFLRLARHGKRFKSVEDPVAYAFVAARNEVRRWLSHRQRDRERRRTLAQSPTNNCDVSVCALWETTEWIASALGRLDVAQQEIVELRFYGGLTFAEIAHVLDTPQGTVATRYRAAIARLRDCLTRESP